MASEQSTARDAPALSTHSQKHAGGVLFGEKGNCKMANSYFLTRSNTKTQLNQIVNIVVGQLYHNLPVIGIVAFSACSISAVAHYFLDRSQYRLWVYWPAAVLVEGFTAWLIASAVERLHILTRSNISKQDKRFNISIFALYIVLAIPTLVVSTLANRVEFSGDWWLALLFPSLSIGCAAGAAIPVATQRYEARKQKEKAEKARKKDEKQTQIAQVAPQARATITDWRTIYRNMDGEREGIAADGVALALKSAGFAQPSRRTLQNWAKEAQVSVQETKGAT